MGYGKPVVTVEDGQLVVKNVPPPRRRHSPLFQLRYGDALQELDLLRWLNEGIAERRAAEREEWEKNIQPSALAIFHELHRLHTEHGRTGVLVHFPVESDYSDGASNGWRKWLGEEARANGWIFVDLIPALRALPRDQVRDLFIQDDADRFRGAAGHYTERGNQLMARALLQELTRQGVLDRPAQYPAARSGSAAPAGLKAQFLQDQCRGAEAGEGGLYQVHADEGGEREPPRIHLQPQRETDQHETPRKHTHAIFHRHG
jgi:hypothetical protein